MNQRGFVKVILVLAIVVIAGAVGYFALVTNRPPVVQQTTTPTSTAIPAPATRQPTSSSTELNSKGEVANWKTFTNTKYGYTLKYPPDAEVSYNWEIPGDSLETFFAIYVGKEAETLFEVEAQETFNGVPPWDETINLDLKHFAEKIWQLNTRAGDLTQTTVDGLPAFQFSKSKSYLYYRGGGEALTEETVFIFVADRKGEKFILSFSTNNKQSQQILRTFEFAR